MFSSRKTRLSLHSLLIPLSVLASLAPGAVHAADPCATDAPRALVLGSGG